MHVQVRHEKDRENPKVILVRIRMTGVVLEKLILLMAYTTDVLKLRSINLWYNENTKDGAVARILLDANSSAKTEEVQTLIEFIKSL